VTGEKAHKLGLVDKVVPSSEVLNAAVALARDIASGKVARQFALDKKDKLEPSVAVKQIVEMAGGMAKKQSPHMPQPQAALRAVAAGVNNITEGRQVEANEFAKLGKNPVSKALIHLFLAQRACTKVDGIAHLKARSIKSAAVIGGGLMGSGIATTLVSAGIKVLLKEINQELLDAGVGRVKANLQSRVKKGSLTQEKFEKTMALLVPVLTYDAFNTVDIVIEAVIEKVDLKQRVFLELEKFCNPNCILATNTSTINIDLISQKISPSAQKRVIGAHFFSPAHIMPLL
jgi:enoyl-CoA hydratase/3-hydroxyacyl-CoA dehydrogenase